MIEAGMLRFGKIPRLLRAADRRDDTCVMAKKKLQ
jgi:hypothetical protein